MADLAGLSNEELLRKLNQSVKSSGSSNISSLSDEEIMAKIGKQPLTREQHVEQLQQQMAQQPQQSFASALGDIASQSATGAAKRYGAMGAGTVKGALNIGRGAGELEAKLADYLTGSQFAGKAPRVELPQAAQDLMESKPESAGIGEFAGEMLASAGIPIGKGKYIGKAVEMAPRGLKTATRLAGSIGKGMASGAATAPLYQPDEDLVDSWKQGAMLGGGGAVAGELISAAPVAGRHLLTKFFGGGNTAEEVKRNIEAFKNIGAEKEASIGAIIESPHASGMESVGATIPGSGYAKDFQTVGKKIEKAVSDAMSGMKPSDGGNITSRSLNYINDVKKGIAKERKIANRNFTDLEDAASKSNVLIDKSDIHNTANEIMSEISNTDLGEKKYIKDILNDALKKETSPVFGTRLKGSSSFKEALKMRKDINKSLGDLSHDDNQERRILSSLKSSIDSSMEKAAEISGDTNVVDLLRKANKHYAEEVAPLNSKEVTKFTHGDADPDTFIPTFLKTGQMPREALIEKVSKHLSDKNKKSFAHTYLDKSSREVLGIKGNKKEKLLSDYMKIPDNVKGKLFDNKHREKLDSAYVALKSSGGDLNQMLNPPTGNKLQKALSYVLSASTLGAVPIGSNILRRASKSKAVKESILKALEEGDANYIEREFSGLSGLSAPTVLSAQNSYEDYKNGK